MCGANPNLHFPNSYVVFKTLLKCTFPHCLENFTFCASNPMYFSLFLGILFCFTGISV